jgi:hypothetical protein
VVRLIEVIKKQRAHFFLGSQKKAHNEYNNVSNRKGVDP